MNGKYGLRKIRSRMMSGIKGKNTKPEILVRKTLHAKGYRFRFHGKKLLGKPDIVVAKYQTVVLYIAVSSTTRL